jgi:hypothetical protein
MAGFTRETIAKWARSSEYTEDLNVLRRLSSRLGGTLDFDTMITRKDKLHDCACVELMGILHPRCYCISMHVETIDKTLLELINKRAKCEMILLCGIAPTNVHVFEEMLKVNNHIYVLDHRKPDCEALCKHDRMFLLTNMTGISALWNFAAGFTRITMDSIDKVNPEVIMRLQQREVQTWPKKPCGARSRAWSYNLNYKFMNAFQQSGSRGVFLRNVLNFHPGTPAWQEFETGDAWKNLKKEIAKLEFTAHVRTTIQDDHSVIVIFYNYTNESENEVCKLSEIIKYLLDKYDLEVFLDDAQALYSLQDGNMFKKDTISLATYEMQQCAKQLAASSIAAAERAACEIAKS